MAIFRLLVLLVVIYLLYKIGRRFFLSAGKTANPLPNKPAPDSPEDLVEDPWCHTFLPISQAHKASIHGQSVYFCSSACCEKYRSKGNDSD
jgi:uncharacterized protein